MLDVLFLHPGEAKAIYGGLADELTAIEPSPWVRMLAGYVRDRGFDVQIVDAEAVDLSPEKIAILVDSLLPRLVVIVAAGHQPSASTQSMTGAHAAAEAIKAIAPTQKIIMVGGHCAALPERTLREEPVGYVCSGEGFKTIASLLAGMAPEVVPDLHYRKDGELCVSPVRASLIADLDADAIGDVWDLLPMSKYRAHPWQCFGDISKRKPYASVYTSLGCPYSCGFCMINAPFGNTHRYRTRSAESVANEVIMLHEKYGVKTFKFADEMFVLKDRHYLDICSRLADYGVGSKINIWAYARVDTVKAENLATMRAGGIRWLALGIEAGSKYVRDGADKALRNDDIIDVVRAIQRNGIAVIGNYIFGLGDDDQDSMQSTLDLAMGAKTEFANFYSAMAYPGSKFYDDAVKSGRALPEKWSGYSQHSYDCFPLGNDKLTPAEVLKFRDDAFQRYYTDPDYLVFVEKKFGAETRAYVENMAAHPLPRKLLGT